MLLARALEGDLELIVSPQLLEELEVVLIREKFRRYFTIEEVEDYLVFIGRLGTVVPDPIEPPPFRSADPKDDYLIALAYTEKAILVSGDSHLLDLTGGAPICAPADLLGAPIG